MESSGSSDLWTSEWAKQIESAQGFAVCAEFLSPSFRGVPVNTKLPCEGDWHRATFSSICDLQRNPGRPWAFGRGSGHPRQQKCVRHCWRFFSLLVSAARLPVRRKPITYSGCGEVSPQSRMPLVESKLKKKQSLLRSFPVFQDTRSFTLAERRGSEPKPWKSPAPHTLLCCPGQTQLNWRWKRNPWKGQSLWWQKKLVD